MHQNTENGDREPPTRSPPFPSLVYWLGPNWHVTLEKGGLTHKKAWVRASICSVFSSHGKYEGSAVASPTYGGSIRLGVHFLLFSFVALHGTVPCYLFWRFFLWMFVFSIFVVFSHSVFLDKTCIRKDASCCVFFPFVRFRAYIRTNPPPYPFHASSRWKEMLLANNVSNPPCSTYISHKTTFFFGCS